MPTTFMADQRNYSSGSNNNSRHTNVSNGGHHNRGSHGNSSSGGQHGGSGGQHGSKTMVGGVVASCTSRAAKYFVANITPTNVFSS